MSDPLEKRWVDEYLATVDRLEPSPHPIDLTAAATSIAVSLKRIADNLDVIKVILANPPQEVRRDPSDFYVGFATMNNIRSPWYGFLSYEEPIICCVTNDGPFGDRIAWWSYVVLPQVCR